MKARGARRPALRAGATLALVCAAGFLATRGDAQLVDPRRPTRLVVGPLRGPGPTPRGDAQRRGRARDPLPTGPLEPAFRHALGATTSHAALAGDDGRSLVVTDRGDVVVLDAEGEERAHANAVSSTESLATLISDGTLVVATAGGDVVGVGRDGRVRFTRHVLEGRARDVAPLALDDGGVVLAAGAELVVLDAQGNVRARTPLPEPPAGPLLAWRDHVVVVSVLGTVFAAPPGGPARRVGSFGGPVDGGAALVDADVLTGVVGGQLVDVDLAKTSRISRASPPDGVFLGPVTSWAPGGARAVALMHLGASGVTSVVAFDAAGAEKLRALLPGSSAVGSADAGAALVVPPHVGTLADARGAVAFATPDGVVGVLSPGGDVGQLAAPPCSKVGRSAGVAGLTPAGPGAFLVTCQAGVVVLVRASAAPGTGHGSGL